MTPKNIFRAAVLASAFVPAAALAQTPPPHVGSGFAVVDSTGALISGGDATSATRLGLGTYEVDFSNSVKKCVFTATTGLPGSEGVNNAGFVTVAGRGNNDAGVYLKTYDADGNSADIGFHLNVRC